MLVVEKLMLKEGMSFSTVHFDGTKEELKENIELGGMITFTYTPEGRTKELNVSGASIMCYEIDVDTKEALNLDSDLFEGAQIFLFPTAGFGQKAVKQTGAATEKLIHDLFGQYFPKKPRKN